MELNVVQKACHLATHGMQGSACASLSIRDWTSHYFQCSRQRKQSDLFPEIFFYGSVCMCTQPSTPVQTPGPTFSWWVEAWVLPKECCGVFITH